MQELKFKILLPFLWFGLTFGQPLCSTSKFCIFGGRNVSIEDAPYMAMYRHYNSPYGCGAVIVHEQFVLTARHCLATNSDIKTRISVGTDKCDLGGTDYEVEEAFHTDDDSEVDSDIAVIKLKEKLEFSKTVQKLEMAEPGLEIEDGDTTFTLGFGRTESGKASNQLLGVELPYVEHNKCAEFYKDQWPLSEVELCAGGVKGKGDCFGDSGGPLVWNNKVIGIVFRGSDKGCAVDRDPTVFTSVSAVRDFIDKIISEK